MHPSGMPAAWFLRPYDDSLLTGGSDSNAPIAACFDMIILRLLKRAISRFVEDDALSLAASVSFYTALSFAPIVLLIVTIGGTLSDSTKTHLVRFFDHYVGYEASYVTEDVIEDADAVVQEESGWRWPFTISILLFSASGVFAQLQYALNRIWSAEVEPQPGIWVWIRRRLLSMGMIFTFMFILLVALVISSLLEYFVPEGLDTVARIASVLMSIAVFTMLFASVYKVLPDTTIEWKYIWSGSLLTAILFTLGQYLITLYLQYGRTGRGYSEAVGTFIALLLWVYFSSIIFFFGAEVTHEYARWYRASSRSRSSAQVASEQT